MLQTHHITFLFLPILLLGCGPKNWKCIEGNCYEGKGTKHWDDGGIEKGGWKRGKHNGDGYQYFGKNSVFAGDTYQGEFLNDEYHGFGVYKDSSSGGTYEGYWKSGKAHGKGTSTWDESSDYPNRSYEGEWENGMRHGYGVKFWGESNDKWANSTYMGEWKNDLMDGIGKFEWADGSYYEGPWKEGNQHGQGMYVFANGEIFEGFWDEGVCPELSEKLKQQGAGGDKG